ncbi:hypothetical protein [Ferrimonas pelagia]|uniref:DUF551 domain-containing protein n=1 Tax=Ferrimonas pelagia TaxID=1177826 RepID=A0ABP9EBB0_9GAMM
MEWVDITQAQPDDGAVVLVWMPNSQQPLELARYLSTHGFVDLDSDWQAHGDVSHWMAVSAPSQDPTSSL